MKKYIIANWKSNKNIQEMASWLNNFPDGDENRKRLQPLEIILALPFPLLVTAKEIIDDRNLPISLAVQNISAFGSGSYTGEVAADNLKFLDLAYVILGHSERRRLLKESSQEVAAKVSETIKASLKPILCLDEPYFKEQFELLKKDELSECLLAYEPVSAIGSGKAFDLEKLREVKEELLDIYPRNSKFIYGGSVNAENVADYLKFSDGVLVGGASLDLRDFVDLLFSSLQACQA